MPEATAPSPDNASLQQQRKDKASGRWQILRDALLHKAVAESEHSIHRFLGYNLLKECGAESVRNAAIKKLEPLLMKYDIAFLAEQSLEELQVAVLALAACYPKGKCLTVTMPLQAEEDIGGSDNPQPSKFKNREFFDQLKQKCLPSVIVWIVDQQTAEDGGKITTTLLVQEAKEATNYKVCLYDLEERNNASAKANQHLFLWTREPKQQRLSLDDLVSHRTNGGVDNTGNICVWDSERTLSHLLYHCFIDFSGAVFAMRVGTQLRVPNPICSIDVTVSQHPPVHILELGTGMAGLSALALGLRLVKDQQKRTPTSPRPISITLTDGNEGGVLNNKVNQYLTKLHAQQQDEKQPYLSLDVKCQTLLWTTDLKDNDNIPPADIVLISDCVHFQNFHAALVCTVLRQLQVGGIAVFCQPTRGDSLNNFCSLLDTVDGLMSRRWWKPPVVDEMHEKSKNDPKYTDLYDENLHRPRLLLVIKKREMTAEDREALIAKHDQQYWEPRRQAAKKQQEGVK